MREGGVKKIGFRLAPQKLKHLAGRQIDAIKAAPNPPISTFALCEEYKMNDTASKPLKGLLPDFTKTPQTTTARGSTSFQFNRFTKLGEIEAKRPTSKKVFIEGLSSEERKGLKWGSVP